ncbi:MAG: SDR family NAD(P)-dependent oxidoreductase [Alphaproteobacteria bacterium]
MFGNAGQANYVAGCRFKDAFAAHLRTARGVPALTVDWGYWGSVGVVADDALRARLARQGILAIAVEEGIDAFERALAAGAAQVLPVAATPETFARLGVAPDETQAEPGPAPEPAAMPARILAAAAAAHPATPLEAVEEEALRRLERLAARDVAAALHGLGFGPGPALPIAEWARRLTVAPAWEGLFAALVDLLRRAELVDVSGDGVRPLLLPPAEPGAHAAVLRAAPALQAHARLLERCVAALPEVLRGRGSGLSALMPGGSPALVEAVYVSAAVTERLNRQLAAVVRVWAAERPHGRPLRVLEVGGGTGGTTRSLVPVLAEIRPDAQYLFTDVSPAFLPEAERRFATVLAGFRAARLDIAGDPAGDEERFDLVVAANVLHATPDLGRSLAHCRRLLRPGGLLLLNESASVRDFATLTFGLTPGWWASSDPADRLPHGPAVAAAGWRRLLARAGFLAAHALPAEGEAPQMLFAAEAPPAVAGGLGAHIAAIVGRVLKLDADAIDPAEPFGTYGLESTMALEVIAALEDDFGTLPKALLFEATSTAALAAWLERERPDAALRLASAARGPVAAPAPASAPVAPAGLADDAIAVVAVAGRYPGARTPDALWELLRDGRSAIGEVPPERWDHGPHFDPERRRDDKAHTRFGGFVDAVDTFDAALFRISPAEARAIDPMERQFIEVVWELLENAGRTPERLKAVSKNDLGGDVGIFVGVMSQTYEQLATEMWADGRYTGAFSSHSSIANRASFLFDLTGPSVAVDTACSSSLSAIHMACEAIRRGDCRAAVAGGANLLLHPLHHILLSAYRVLSPDDRTRAFGAGGQGFVVGEGVGAVLLRPLADALSDGDPVLAVVRGSAVNTCGRTTSYSAPSVGAQADVIGAALRRARVEPATITYVEAHGTGTELGDPVEIRGLSAGWGDLPPSARCAIGSIKTNIGHLEAAAGIAGFTKLLLQLRHGMLAPSLHAEPPNPNIDFAATPFRVQTHLAPWTAPGPRRAGISSFGLGGANAHVIVEEPPGSVPSLPDDGLPLLVVASARTEERLRVHLGRLAAHLRATPGTPLRDIAWTLQVGRQAQAVRWAAVVPDAAALLAAIDGWLAGRPVAGLHQGEVRRLGTSDAAGAAPDPRMAGDPAAMAAHWVAGGRIEPDRLLRGPRPRIVALPNYPFEAKRYWLDEGPGFSKAAVAASRAAARSASPVAARPAGDPVADYYDATLPVAAERVDEAYFSLAPMPAPPPGFSWTRTVLDPASDPRSAEALLAGQRLLRRMLFDGIDTTGRPLRVLDFGCGAGTDLIMLARANPRLTGHGRTISPEHARVAAARVRLAGLGERIAIEAGDSAGAPFPGRFDVVLGIEVAHHIRDKDRLLAGLAAALAPGGQVVLADCVAARVGASVPETGSWTLAEADYAATMARAGLRLTRAVDVSGDVANCLDDPELDAVLARLAAGGMAADRLAQVERVHRGWANFGRALRAGMIRYMLLRAEADDGDVAALTAANRAILAGRAPAPRQSATGDAMPVLRRCLARVLGVGEGDVAPAVPFAEQGLDSLGGLKLLDALSAELGRPLDAALLYDHPTPERLADALGDAVPAPPAPAADRRVREQLALVLGAAPGEIDRDTPFATLGLDSLGGLRFLDALNRALGLSLGAETLYDHPTLAALEAHVGGMATVPASPEIVPAAPRHAPDAVAVVGLAVRLPGAPDAESFWRVLRDGIDCVTEVPPDRWNPALHWSPDPERADRSYGKWGGFIADHDRFDARFFGIAAREASLTDPQQRIFLEAAWHALEDAGLATPTIRGTRCGIYVGMCGDEYRELMRAAGVAPDAYLMLGNAGSVLAARLAYLLDLKGPALAIDTACSSSLVALHLAVEAIRRGEIDMAVAGGVSLYLGEWPFKQLSRAGMLSPTGRCRTFGADADGIVPGEGAAVVVLKPLARALADRDRVHGVILGTGINQDGRTNGLTAPSAAAQAALIGEVLDRAGVAADSVGMVEAHGTGTRLGDPVEAAGLVAAFSARTARAGFCALGALKSNIGHTTAASGVAGLVKVLLAMRHGTIPRTLHLGDANPLLRLDGSAFRLARAAEDWRAEPGVPRRGAVSAFGFSGTNAHALLEEAPDDPRPAAEAGWRLVLVSGRDAAALERRIAGLAARLDAAEPPALADLAYTLALRRRHEPARAAYVVADIADLRARLRAPTPRRESAGAPPAPPAAARSAQAWRDWLEAMEAAYVAGADLDLSPLDEGAAVRTVSLPGYPFARERHWFGPARTAPSADASVPLSAPRWVAEAAAPGAIVPGVTLAFVRSAADAERLAASLPGPLVAVRAGAACDIAAAVPTIRPDMPQDYRALADLLASRGIVPDRAVHLWPLAAEDDAEAALRDGPRSLFLLLQALTARWPDRPVWVVQARRLGTGAVAACREAAAGLVPSAPQGTALTVSVLVLDDGSVADAAALAATETTLAPAEVRIVAGHREVRRLVPLDAPAPVAALPPGTILVTGGLGGIGRALCRHLAAPGARLALIGRSPPAAAHDFLRELSTAGAVAEYRSADVADAAALATAIAAFRATLGPIAVVHHLAGVMGAEPLATKPAAELDAVLRAKVAGTLALDAATVADAPALFVLHGSLAATQGDFGQGDYAVANRFLEAFAEDRAARRPGRSLCVAWPLWQEGGMRPAAASTALLSRLTGRAPLPTAAALAALDRAIAAGSPVVAVDGPAAAAAPPAVPVEAPVATAPLLPRLIAAAAAVLRTDPETLDPAAGLVEHGFDSITLKELATALSRDLCIALSPTVFYRHGSLSEVAAHLAAAHPQVQAPATPAAASPAGGGAVAVIGMAGRFPQAPDLATFWTNLVAGRDAIGPAPAGRPGWAGETLQAGFVDGVERFDADFFQIAPREAALMDPQARLFLETAWHALESAAIAPTSLAGSATGVFVGAQSSDYAEIARGGQAPQLVTGLAHAAIANRVSFLLDLHGPSVAIDAACAAGLAAVHRAVRAIRAGECDLAIAGAVNLLLSPDASRQVSAMGVLAPDGRCKSFAADADGYGRGEGVVALVLKPLAAAEAAGDPILGVILAGAEGHGGHAASLTAPNPAAQAALLLRAWEEADIAAAAIAHVEAHGTGTELGDPIEVEGLREALAAHAARRGEPALSVGAIGLGTVKSAIGHLEPASGVAGLVKLLLAFRHRTMPPTLHCARPNPLLRLDDAPLRLTTAAEPWPEGDRVAVVSAFGFTGAMAHLVVAPAPTAAAPASAAGTFVLPLSARSAAALRRQAEALAAVLSAPDAPALAAAARTLQHGRTAFEHRLAVVADGTAEAAAHLRAWLAGGDTGEHVFAGAAATRRPFRDLLRPEAPTDGADEPAAMARAWAAGRAVRWPAATAAAADLPTYPFEPEVHWIDAPASDPQALRLAAIPGLADHVADGVAILPAAATAAVLASAGRPHRHLRGLLWLRPLPLDAAAMLDLGEADAGGERPFEIRDGEGAVAVSGLVREDAGAAPAPVDPARLRAACPERIAGEALYADFAAAGLACGPAFRRIDKVLLSTDDAIAALRGSGAGAEPDPAALDAAAQAGALLLRRAGEEPLRPYAADRVRIFDGLAAARFVTARRVGPRTLDLAVLDGAGRVLAAIDGFVARPVAAAAAPLSAWIPAWEEAPAIAAAPASGRALVVRHAADLGLTDALARIHGVVEEIHLGSVERRLGPSRREIDQHDPEGLARALAAVGPCDRIYFLGALTGLDRFAPAMLPALRASGIDALFRLARALAAGGSAATLVAVTERAQRTASGEPVLPAAGGVAGLCLSLGREWAKGRVVAVDIDAGVPAAVAAMLAAETAEAGVPVEIAYRGGRRLGRALRPAALAAGEAMPEGVHLIVGGAGGIGAALARHLARRPGNHVVLTGRRPADARIAALLAELARAEYVAADAADGAAMAALVADLRRRHGRIAGVVHAALVLDNRPIATMDDPAWRAAGTPKMEGSLWLADAFAAEPPGYIALFSSLIALSGGAGQANYAAGAGFQDAFGLWLADRVACPVRIVDWGFWSDTGSVATPVERARLARLGMGGIATAEGLAAFERVMAQPETRLVVARTVETAKAEPARAAPPAVTAVAGRPAVLDWLRGIFAEILGRSPAALPEHEPLAVLGVDSLVNMQVLQRLERDLGRLPRTLLFEHGSIGALADHVAAAHGTALGHLAGPQPVTVPATAPPAVDGVAIIGLACRFPGADTPDAFWEMVRAGRDAFGPVPADRWQAPAGARGAFLDRVDLFDPLHFGISFREAAAMDPQEKLFLETAWHALEDAGHTRTGLRRASLAATGRDVGVYVGVMNGAFQLHAARPGSDGTPVQAIAPYWSIANRVSWLFDFHGPSIAVDTACSASAAALHLACTAIARGEIGAALVGGVSLLLHPRQYETMQAMHMLSPRGRCSPFAAGADGFVPGEGVAAVVLRPLADALAAGDRILGVVRGSAMNTGGRTSGYTVPSPAAQAEVVAEALRSAGVDPAAIGYVEAHGTGTALGDPIEIEGLNRALGRAPGACAVGSVKALVGHLESAAGMAGLTRVLMQFRHGEIAPTPLAGPLNPAIALDGGRIVLPAEPAPWTPPPGGRRLAGLSSFGAGGVNVHLVLEEPPAPPEVATDGPVVVPLSARSPEQLTTLAARLAEAVAAGDVALPRIARSLQSGRETLACRAAFVARDRSTLAAALRAFAAGGSSAVATADGADALNALASDWVAGQDVAWPATPHGARPTSLPGYPFARERHWPAGLDAPGAGAAASPRPHPLIERVLPSLHGAAFAVRLGVGDPLLADHRVDGSALLPGTAVLELARAAAAAAGIAPTGLAGVAWLAPLPAPVDATLTLTERGDVLRFELTSGDGEARLRHATGQVLRDGRGPPPPAEDCRRIAAALPVRLEGADIYQRLARLGVDYGPGFRGLAEITCDADTVVARLAPEAVAATAAMPWHPAVLDMAVQATMGLLGAAGRVEPLVPFLVEAVTVRGPLDGARWVLVRRRPATDAADAAADIALLDEAGAALATLDRVTLRRRRPPVEAASEPPLAALDAIAAARFLDRLRAGGLSPAPVEETALRRGLRVAPRHARLMEAAFDLLGARRWIARAGTALHLTPSGAAAADGWHVRQDRLAAAEPALAPHLELLDLCMADLGGILDGEVPATDAFFPGGSMELLTRVYAGDAHAATLHRHAAEAVVAAVRRVGRPARVLEIGAGTGGTTAAVVDALAAASLPVEYVFTDLSPRFMQQARTRFAPLLPGFATAVLDIARDPAAQGQPAGGFDVVLAANVLHATADIGATVGNAARLLAPDGTLIVNEMTAARDYATLTFGLLEGWWLAVDPDRRLPHAPLLSVAQWRAVLAEAGLDRVEATLPPGIADEAAAPQAVLVARRVPAAARPERLAAAPASRVAAIEAAVMAVVAQVFEMPVETVRRGGVLSFAELGGDSLLSAELAARLGDRFGVALKTTAIFNYPTIPALAAHIAEEFPTVETAPAPAPPESNPEPAPDPSDAALAAILKALEEGTIDVDTALARVPAPL